MTDVGNNRHDEAVPSVLSLLRTSNGDIYIPTVNSPSFAAKQDKVCSLGPHEVGMLQPLPPVLG